jgi:cytochrome bd ubiquinol oxidase subunit I
MVALGTLLSSFWILSANSWMQTPAGYSFDDGRFFPTDWAAIVFNPSFPCRLAHNVGAFFVTTAFYRGALITHTLKMQAIKQAKIDTETARLPVECLDEIVACTDD